MYSISFVFKPGVDFTTLIFCGTHIDDNGVELEQLNLLMDLARMVRIGNKSPLF